MVQRRWIPAFVVLSLLGGCVSEVRVPRELVRSPAVPKGEALCAPVLLQLDDELREYVHSAKSATVQGMNTTYHFHVGEGLAPALEDGLRDVFPLLEVSRTPPEAPGELERYAAVLRVGLRRADVRIEFEPRWLSTLAKAQCLVELETELRDAAGAIVFGAAAEGTGSSQTRTRRGEAASLEPCVAQAVHEVVDRLCRELLQARSVPALAVPCPER
jgi:hypothetical protein